MGSPVLGRELVVSRGIEHAMLGCLSCFFLGAVCTLRSPCYMNVGEFFSYTVLLWSLSG